MAIEDLKPKQTNVEVVGDIIEVGDVREFQKFGKSGRVATAILKDETGKVKLSLWNEQTEQVKKGDRVHIKNGYVNEWQGELQLTTGKFGTLEVLGSSSDEKVQSITEDEMKEKDALEGGKETGHVLTEDEATEEEDLEELGKKSKRPSNKESETEDEKKEAKQFEEENLNVEEENIDDEEF